MKQNLLFVIFLLFLTTDGICLTTSSISTISCSTKILKSDNKLGKDTLPEIELTKSVNEILTPVYYINGIHYNSSILRTINPKFIDSIKVEKKEIEIVGKKYYGQIYIKLKKEYNPNLISLSELKQKYTKQTSNPTIYMIDNDIIKDNYADYLVDEKYILKIIFDTIENKEEKLHVEVIRLITRTEENIKQTNEIRIRGIEEQLK